MAFITIYIQTVDSGMVIKQICKVSELSLFDPHHTSHLTRGFIGLSRGHLNAQLNVWLFERAPFTLWIQREITHQNSVWQN